MRRCSYDVAVDADWVLWFAGSVTGLVAAAAVSYLTFTRHLVRPDSAFGGWLMPVVPPMVSASTGALFLPFAPSGQAQLDLLLCCYALFGISLLASVIVITLIWYRLALRKAGDARMVPTLWIVLGPLGQSITAANLLGTNAHLAVPAAEATILKTIGVISHVSLSPPIPKATPKKLGGIRLVVIGTPLISQPNVSGPCRLPPTQP